MGRIHKGGGLLIGRIFEEQQEQQRPFQQEKSERWSNTRNRKQQQQKTLNVKLRNMSLFFNQRYRFMKSIRQMNFRGLFRVFQQLSLATREGISARENPTPHQSSSSGDREQVQSEKERIGKI